MPSYAGHEPGILHLEDGTVEDLSASGMPIGMFEDLSHSSAELQHRPGEMLVVHIDGIAETCNSGGVQLCRHRIVETIARQRNSAADTVRATNLDEVNTFGDKTPLVDDHT